MHRQIVMLTVLICVLAASAHAAQISVEPVYQEVSQGDNITIDVVVYPEESGIYGASYTLYFNNTLLNATSQTQGPFLRQDGQSTSIFVDKINNTLGKIEYAECRMGTYDEVTGSGVLTTIAFDVIGDEGVSSLNLSDLEDELLYNTSGSVPADINNGSIEVRKGICGDVDGQDGVTIGDGIQIAMSIVYGTDDYPLENPWAADVDCQDGVTIGDGIQIAMSIVYGTEKYPLECC
jgi:hypothetical protein